jgi:hypothetical protein
LLISPEVGSLSSINKEICHLKLVIQLNQMSELYRNGSMLHSL